MHFNLLAFIQSSPSDVRLIKDYQEKAHNQSWQSYVTNDECFFYWDEILYIQNKCTTKVCSIFFNKLLIESKWVEYKFQANRSLSKEQLFHIIILYYCTWSHAKTNTNSGIFPCELYCWEQFQKYCSRLDRVFELQSGDFLTCVCWGNGNFVYALCCWEGSMMFSGRSVVPRAEHSRFFVGELCRHRCNRLFTCELCWEHDSSSIVGCTVLRARHILCLQLVQTDENLSWFVFLAVFVSQCNNHLNNWYGLATGRTMDKNIMWWWSRATCCELLVFTSIVKLVCWCDGGLMNEKETSLNE